ncbi:MAG: hypothetical protein IPI19_11055 [Ignavibacteriales bacterium]|nr:hypothetical protein [Ignavibacteriales bacterium]
MISFSKPESRAKLYFIILGSGLIIYAVYLLINSTSLASISNPGKDLRIPYIGERIFIGVLFLFAVLSIKDLPSTSTWIGWIIFIGFAVRFLLIPTTPAIEDDFYRYHWDGAVTANGFNPYKYSPKEVLDKSSSVPNELILLGEQSGEILKNVNNPKLKSLYPSISQGLFALSYLISPWNLFVWKLLLLIGDIVLLFFLLKVLKELKLPLVFAGIYWLNPIVIHEFFNAAHMDLFVILFMVISIYLLLKKNYLGSIIFLAIAVGIRVYPIILFPLYISFMWSDKKEVLKSTILFGVLNFIIFIPVILAGSYQSSGFAKYAGNWINNAALFDLLNSVIKIFDSFLSDGNSCTHCLARWIVSAIMLFVVIYYSRKAIRSNNDFLERAALILAIMFLISPTQFPWYYTWIFPLLVFRPKISFLIYPALLPLYQLNKYWEYFIYIQHIPVILLFLYELKKGYGFGFFNISEEPYVSNNKKNGL